MIKFIWVDFFHRPSLRVLHSKFDISLFQLAVGQIWFCLCYISQRLACKCLFTVVICKRILSRFSSFKAPSLLPKILASFSRSAFVINGHSLYFFPFFFLFRSDSFRLHHIYFLMDQRIISNSKCVQIFGCASSVLFLYFLFVVSIYPVCHTILKFIVWPFIFSTHTHTLSHLKWESYLTYFLFLFPYFYLPPTT